MELFCYGTHFLDRTWMKGYLRLPPASIVTVDATGLQTSRYWVYRYEEDGRRLDQQTYASVCGILLDRAVARCMHGMKRIGIFLSGRYDSRSVAAAIPKHRRPLPAFTFGVEKSRDVRFGSMLAGRLGLEHHVLTLQNAYLYRNCRAIVWRTEGMVTFANATSIHWHSVFKEKMDIILTGFLGEFGGSHSWPQLLLARSRRAAHYSDM
jgi:asparagine synthetase B (glutamine-hydrolysing)